LGKSNLKKYSPTNDPHQCFCFSYTSGTTGDPKAVMLSHYSFTTMIEDIRSKKFPPPNKNDVHLSYLPLPHVFERMNIWNLTTGGA
jgi:long-chain acyl-CoA synthetase